MAQTPKTTRTTGGINPDAIKIDDDPEAISNPETPATDTGGITFVYSNVPQGHNFHLITNPDAPDPVHQVGAGVSLKPAPRRGFVDEGVGKYSVTVVDSSLWAEVKKNYDDCPMFKNGSIFDAPSREVGDAMAYERAGVPTIRQAVDPNKLKAKPYNKED